MDGKIDIVVDPDDLAYPENTPFRCEYIRHVRLGGWLFGNRKCLLVRVCSIPENYSTILTEYLILYPRERGATSLPIVDSNPDVVIYTLNTHPSTKRAFGFNECNGISRAVIRPSVTSQPTEGSAQDLVSSAHDSHKQCNQNVEKKGDVTLTTSNSGTNVQGNLSESLTLARVIVEPDEMGTANNTPFVCEFIRRVRLGTWLFGQSGCLLVRVVDMPDIYESSLTNYIIIHPRFWKATRFPIPSVGTGISICLLKVSPDSRDVFQFNEIEYISRGSLYPAK